MDARSCLDYPGFGLAASTFGERLTLSSGFSGEAMGREWAESLVLSVTENLSRFTSRLLLPMKEGRGEIPS